MTAPSWHTALTPAEQEQVRALIEAATQADREAASEADRLARMARYAVAPALNPCDPFRPEVAR